MDLPHRFMSPWRWRSHPSVWWLWVRAWCGACASRPRCPHRRAPGADAGVSDARMHGPVSVVDGVDRVGQAFVQAGFEPGERHVRVAVGQVGEDDGGARPPQARRAVVGEDAGGQSGDLARIVGGIRGSRVQIPLVRPRKPVVSPFPQY